jgi:hypothetical protein
MIIKYTCEPYLPVGQRRDQVLHEHPDALDLDDPHHDNEPGAGLEDRHHFKLMMKSKQNYLAGLIR